MTNVPTQPLTAAIHALHAELSQRPTKGVILRDDDAYTEFVSKIERAANDIRDNVSSIQSRVSELEDELYEAQQLPWPEWAERILKAMRKSGYDPVNNDEVDLADAFEDYLAGIDDAERHDAERLASLQSRIAELEKENEALKQQVAQDDCDLEIYFEAMLNAFNAWDAEAPISDEMLRLGDLVGRDARAALDQEAGQ